MGDALSENAALEAEAGGAEGAIRLKRWVKRGESTKPGARGRLVYCHAIEHNRVLLELEFDKPRRVGDNLV